MSAPTLPSLSSPDAYSAVVAALRAAGCVFAEDEASLLISAATTAAELAAMVDRRVAGLPLEHVVGWAEFCGLRIVVEPGVFVPRRRTEFLARQAAESIGPGAVVVDLCCGSGAVGAVLAATVAGIELHAADIDPAAVRCALHNLATAGHVYQGDLFAPLPDTLRGRVDVLVANAPYVPTDELGLLPAEARDHEPRVALDGGRDGLDVLRRVATAAPQWLAPGGRLLVESSERQAPDIVAQMSRSGLSPHLATCDDLYATVVVGTLPGGPALHDC
jgi:release factor glutamine methyltransferase